MPKFKLPDLDPEVFVSIPTGYDLSLEQLLAFPAFKNWLSTLRHSLSLQQDPIHTFNSDPYKLRGIEIQSIDHFGGNRLGFIKFKTDISNDAKEKLPGAVFLRGGSVAMMLVLQADDVPKGSETDKYVILTVQPRVPAGSLSFVEIPAGMIDDSGTFAGAAAKEISEETDLKIPADELLDITKLALPASPDGGEELQAAMYPSCGGSDEFIPIFLWEKRIPRDQLKDWEGKLTGLRSHGEKITLQLARLEDLWKVAGRDAKALAAWSLYQGLKKEDKI